MPSALRVYSFFLQNLFPLRFSKNLTGKTGQPERLNRFKDARKDNHTAYSKEELVAELGSANKYAKTIRKLIFFYNFNDINKQSWGARTPMYL